MAENYIDKISKNGVEYDIHSSNGGSKLYRHRLQFSQDPTLLDVCYVDLYTNFNTPLEESDLLDTIHRMFYYVYNSKTILKIICYKQFGNDEYLYTLNVVPNVGTHKLTFYGFIYDGTASYEEIDTQTFVIDQIIEL